MKDIVSSRIRSEQIVNPKDIIESESSYLEPDSLQVRK